MKRIVETDETTGFNTLIGEDVVVWCLNYIYAGKLEAVGDSCIELTNASVVYETGPLNTKGFQDAQQVPNSIYVRLNCVESFSLQVK